MTERLRRISYKAMMGFLKQSSLQELALRNAGGINDSKVNTVDTVPAGYPASGFHAAGIFSIHTDSR